MFLWRAFHYPNLPVTPTAAAYHLTSYAPPLVRAELVELVADMVVLNTLVPSLSTDADAAASGTGSGADGRNVDDEETDGSADVWLEPRRFLAAPRVLADQSAAVRLAAAYALEQVRSAPPPPSLPASAGAPWTDRRSRRVAQTLVHEPVREHGARLATWRLPALLPSGTAEETLSTAVTWLAVARASPPAQLAASQHAVHRLSTGTCTLS